MPQMTHIQIKESQICKQIYLVILLLIPSLPHYPIYVVLNCIVHQLVVQSFENHCLQLQNNMAVSGIYPISQLRRIDFLVFHGNKKTGLGSCHSFELIFEHRQLGAIQIKVEYSQMKSSSEQFKLKIHFIDMADQMISQSIRNNSIVSKVLSVNRKHLFSFADVFSDILSVLSKLVLPCRKLLSLGLLILTDFCLLLTLQVIAEIVY